jgi:heat shock protein HslJ
MRSKKKIVLFFLLIGMLALAACAPQGSGVPVTGDTPDAGTPAASPELPAKAVLDAQQWLATQLKVGTEEVQIIEAEQAEWTDSCLGLGRPDESCLQAITPGWRAVFEVNGQRYEIRTDRSGSVIRLASPEGSQPSETGLENTQWTLASFGSAGAEQPLVEGSEITLMLGGGQAGGSGGCNSYGGTYQVDGNSIRFDEIIRTERACADQRVTEQEQRYFQALETASEYQVEGDRLRITYNGGEGLLIFESAPAGGPTPVEATPGS